MRLLELPPPRRPASIPWDKPAELERPADVVRHEMLADPESTDFPRRHFLNPEDGWFRRTERAVNKFLSRRIFPRVPLIRRPYAAVLDRSLTVSEALVPLRGMGGTEPVRALVISDIHAGPFLSPTALKRTFQRLLTLEPDLILLPGDFTTVSVGEVEEAVAALRCLRAPLGVYGVLGNHDYYTEDTNRLCRLLESSGIDLLQNRSVIVERTEARFVLGGVDDLLGGRPDFARALRARPADLPTVVLSHNPDVFPEAARRGVSLLLAGHTHGGQVRVPGLPVLVRMSRYRLDEGRYAVDDSELIVSRGLGVTGLPLRIACPPEALLVTLQPAHGSGCESASKSRVSSSGGPLVR